jgi:hypothetical protein
MFRFVLPALLLTLTPAASEQLTIRCDVNGGPTLLTFNTATKQMKSEAVGGNTFQEGHITSADDNEIKFEFRWSNQPNRQNRRFHYIRNEARIYSQDDFERLVAAEHCVPVL